MLEDLIDNELIESWYDPEAERVYLAFKQSNVTLDYSPDELYQLENHLKQIFKKIEKIGFD